MLFTSSFSKRDEVIPFELGLCESFSAVEGAECGDDLSLTTCPYCPVFNNWGRTKGVEEF
jgi:hypothetical protein